MPPVKLFHSEAGKSLVHARYRAMLRDWPVPHTELRLPTCEGETFVLRCGLESAPPVVLLHGGMTTSIMWARSMMAWAPHFRIHAIDVIGDPGYSAPSRPSLKSEAHARWLDDVFSGLGLQHAAMVGTSFAGLLALDYAIRRPGKVDSLALLSPAGIAPVRARYVLTAVPLFLLGRRGRRKAFEYVMGLPPELTANGRDFVEFSELVMTHSAMRMKPLPVFTDEELRGLTIPVLVILGANDVVFSASEVQRRLKKLVPHSRIVALPGVGHGLTDPTGTVLEFLLERGELQESR